MGVLCAFSDRQCVGWKSTMLFAELNEERLIKSGRSVGETVVTTDAQYVHMSTELANQVAQYHGFAGAEEFKAAQGVGSKGWMAYYPATGQIVITVGGAVLGTEYYGGWR